MWTPLAIAAALSLVSDQPPAALTLSNVRNTFGELGGTRPDGKLVPGDVLFVGFDIEGVTVEPDGKVAYTMALDVTDTAGKSVFKQEAAEKTDFVPLGGTKLPARAFITVGIDQPPGVYTLKVVVTDKPSQATKALEKKFEVGPRDFGVVAVYASIDDRGATPAPTTGVIGQSIYVQFGVVGFDRALPKAKPKDPKAAVSKQPDVMVEMIVLDEAGKPTLAKPSTFHLVGGVDEKDPGFTLRFLLPLTRLGKYTIRLKATDNLAGKSATFDLPVAVVPSAN
ncbi:MAG: hypothetical protein ACRC7O_09985 [Fimbriiglobus sp.]